jgi:hypothetical protein
MTFPNFNTTNCTSYINFINTYSSTPIKTFHAFCNYYPDNCIWSCSDTNLCNCQCATQSIMSCMAVPNTDDINTFSAIFVPSLIYFFILVFAPIFIGIGWDITFWEFRECAFKQPYNFIVNFILKYEFKESIDELKYWYCKSAYIAILIIYSPIHILYIPIVVAFSILKITYLLMVCVCKIIWNLIKCKNSCCKSHTKIILIEHSPPSYDSIIAIECKK